MRKEKKLEELTEQDERDAHYEVVKRLRDAEWLPWRQDATPAEREAALAKGVDGSYTLYPPRPLKKRH